MKVVAFNGSARKDDNTTILTVTDRGFSLTPKLVKAVK